MMNQEKKATPGVLVIYTGGTIGSKPRDPDPDSPQVVVSWEEFKRSTPEVDLLPYAVDCVELEPRDSCNIDPAYWRQIVEAIEGNYQAYSGFVILHGTDTMVYTACALSFMLRDLGKPVILTGAQRSAMVSIRNDATQNLLTALELANPAASNLPVVPEVCIFFGGLLLRGNRAIKRDATGYVAYETPNVEPLGEAGDKIFIREALVRPLPERGRQFSVRKKLDPHVMPIFIYPGIQEAGVVDGILNGPDLKAVVAMSFGAGNIPTKPAGFVDLFRQARQRGILVANVTQCPRGPVEQGLYETSAELLEAGFVAADDITIEAAQCKLMVLLGDEDADLEEVEASFQRSLAGEQSVSYYTTAFPQGGELATVDAEATAVGRFRFRAVATAAGWQPHHVSRVLLRLYDAQVATAGREPAKFRVFVNLDAEESPDNAGHKLAEEAKRWATTTAGVTLFDVTDRFRATVAPGERVSFTLVCDTKGSTLTWSRADLAVLTRD